MTYCVLKCLFAYLILTCEVDQFIVVLFMVGMEDYSAGWSAQVIAMASLMFYIVHVCITTHQDLYNFGNMVILECFYI